MKNIIKNAIILTLITLVAGTALAYVYSVTKEPILKSQEEKQQIAYESVFDSADSFESIDLVDYQDDNSATISDVRKAIDENGKQIGFVLTTSAKGYGGQISVAMGIKSDGTLNAISILSADDETPGLGAKCKDKDFYGQFTNISENKISFGDESGVNAISGATYSSNGVLDAVNAGLSYFSLNLKEGK